MLTVHSLRLLWVFLGTSCVVPADTASDWAPDYSQDIKSRLGAMRNMASSIAFEHSKSSESAEAIATAVVAHCMPYIDDIARMQVAQVSRSLTQRQQQLFLGGQPEERYRRQLRSAVYERAVADVLECRSDAGNSK